MNAKTATLCGLLAIVLWSSLIALIRSVAQNFGPLAGAALIYTLGTVLLLILVGPPRWRGSSRGYLLGMGLIFAVYEMCLALAIGFAHNSTQTVEVSMVNYLWPSLTVLLAIVINNQRANLLMIPGTLLALFGISWILSGDGFSITRMYSNVTSNPLSYGLAFCGAILWALYCNLTRRFGKGENGITLFFVFTAIGLWLVYLVHQPSFPQVSRSGYVELCAAAAAMASGYALWNIGILRGNMTLLATASYFTPVLSSAFAAFWLGNALNLQFWQGAGLVTVGSLLCWWSTRKG